MASESKQDAIALVKRLTNIGNALSSERNRDVLLEHILLAAKEIANADGGTLYLLSPQGDVLEYVIVRNDSLNIAFGGTTGRKPPFKIIRLYDPDTGQPHLRKQVVEAIVNKHAINVHDAYANTQYDFNGTKTFDANYRYRTQSVITIPMINHRGEPIGCLQLINAIEPASKTVIEFTDEIVEIISSLASQAAVIVDKETLIEQQKILLESFIKMIAQAIDAKSHYTGEHCVRVPMLVEMLADAGCQQKSGRFRDFTLNEEEKYELHIAGWLHDCGKIVTPVHIMDKATKLETIFDRIALLKARCEILKRDAQISYLSDCRAPSADHDALDEKYKAAVTQIESDVAFLESINTGSEFMEDEKIARLKDIARQTITIGGRLHPLITEEEAYNLSIRRGTITPEERQVMNDHMVHTINMLESMPWPKHLEQVPEIACGHHEKMDGSGYPRGILAGTMSVPARMMAVADVFEALTSVDRPYKKPKKISEAMAIIGQFKKNNHLDPDVVDLFVTSKTYLRYAEQFLDKSQIDTVDEAAILAIKPEPMKTKSAHQITDKPAKTGS